MQAFEFDPDNILKMLYYTIENPFHTEPERSKRNIECGNFEEVLKKTREFINISYKYGWYKHLTEEEKNIPEEYFCFVQIPWLQQENQHHGYYHLYVDINRVYSIIIDVNSPFGSSVNKFSLVCRRRDQPLSPEILKTGIREVKFPGPLVPATGNFHTTFNLPAERWLINDHIITYSLARLRLPKIDLDDFPLYIHSNPIVKKYLNLENKLK